MTLGHEPVKLVQIKVDTDLLAGRSEDGICHIGRGCC
jgi:hypothetical protein